MKLALDRTARHFDDNGNLHISSSHISKACVNVYYGQEIVGFEALGLHPEKEYRLFRSPEALQAGADTFKRLPILSKHMPISAEDPHSELKVGSIGSDVVFSEPYLNADLCFWDAKSIAAIESGQLKELSCSYRYELIMKPGEYNGEPYDGVMTNIRGNHLAQVEVGRAGPEVSVSDQQPIKKESIMKTALGKRLVTVLSMISPLMANDSGFSALVGKFSEKKMKKPDFMKSLQAMDEGVSPEQLANVVEAILEVETSPAPEEKPVAVDSTPEEQVRSLLAGKVDEDIINQICAMVGSPAAADKDPAAPEELKTLMDAMKKDHAVAMDSLRKDLQEAEEARNAVRGVVGNPLNVSDAKGIYSFALDSMNINHEGIKELSALKALFGLAKDRAAIPAPMTYGDNGETVKMFPHFSRFSH